MIRRLARRAGSLLALFAVAVPMLASPGLAQDPRALKALDHWMASYLAGKLDLAKDRINKSSPGVRTGIVPEERAATIGHAEELDMICRAVAEHADVDAAERLLNVAAVGLDAATKDSVEMRLQVVRRTGEQWLDRLDSIEARRAIDEVASNERAAKGFATARRAAALRAIGRRKDETGRPILEKALESADAEIRLAAAEACGASELRTVLPALVAGLSREDDELVLTAGLDALLRLVGRHREAVAVDVLRRAADVAAAVLGRATWRSDLAAVELLDKVRSAQSVPALIDVLGRFQAGEEEKASAELRSGLLKERTHEVLISLTGARFAAERADQWRAWWESAKATFEVAELPDPKAGVDEKRTTTGDFFGIPIRGSRVLFVIDCSGSMAEEWRGTSTTTGTTSAAEQKIDVARRELLEAVDKLTADCAFNLVWFGNGSKVWQRDMVPATPKNKQRFVKLAEELRADGGTNLWQGLRDGLKLESFVYGSRYGESYDQLFVLSDGLPTLGDVQDPKEILLLVKETNRYSRLRIDTVYVSGDPALEKRYAQLVGMSGAEFMKRLATENGGTSIEF